MTWRADDYSGTEFRVRWQREGRQRATQIYQTEQAARAKADRLLALDEVKGDPTWIEDMPDLVGSPVIEGRPVGEWSPVDDQVFKPSDEAVESMRAWAAAPDSHEVGPW